MKKYSFLFVFCFLLSGCVASTQALRTSGNTMLVQTSASPNCSLEQTTRVAHMMAAVETIRAGYDRFIIMDSQIQNNVTEETLPGTYRHSGSIFGSGSTASYSGTSYYTPGATVEHGSNDASFHIRMMRENDADAQNALSAREVLGPDWQAWVADGVNTCVW